MMITIMELLNGCERASDEYAMFGSVGIESGSCLWRLGVLSLL